MLYMMYLCHKMMVIVDDIIVNVYLITERH